MYPLQQRTFIRDLFEARYGGKIGEKVFFKVYGQHVDRNATYLADDSKNADAWRLTQAGFRMDWDASEDDAFTVQGDIYTGTRKTAMQHSPMNGQNILGHWKHRFSDRSDMALQVYFDRYFREDAPSLGSDEMNTVDVDFQHRISSKKQHNILWGLGYRFVQDEAIFRTDLVGILPPRKNLDLITGFIQDEINIFEKLKLTVGTKLLHNVYTGIEIQPSLRMAYALRKEHMVWASVSRAVRTPSRFDVDYFLPTYSVPPTSVSIAGGPDFKSEKLLAYELGYRVQPNSRSTFSVAAFYNSYRDIYSVEPEAGTFTYYIQNGSEAKSWGLELSGAYQFTPQWMVRGGYSWFDKDLYAKPGHDFNPDYLSNDARHRILLQSMLDLPFDIKLDFTGRYMDKLPRTSVTEEVPAYFTFDLRLAWVKKHFEVALVGQNLAQKDHVEVATTNIPRSVYAKIIARL